MHLTSSFDATKPDAVFDLDGTVFKFTVLEQFVLWLCSQGVFSPLPEEILAAKLVWKLDNTEENYKAHLGLLVDFFIREVAHKRVEALSGAAFLVAGQAAYRMWDITRNLIEELRPTHNILAISLMPEWLMPPFANDLGFVTHLGSTYVAYDGAFTGEARGIDKAETYGLFRHGDFSRLDFAMGDTSGDRSVFGKARRPIAFNPSRTLSDELESWMTIVTAWKDAVMVVNPNRPAVLLHCREAKLVLSQINVRP